MTRRYVIIVPWDKITDANTRAGIFDPDDGGSDTFGAVQLSTNGLEPQSHSACDTLMSDAVWSGIEGTLTNVTYTITIYRTNNRVQPGAVKRYDDGSWVFVGSGDIMSVALDDMALTRIVTETV